MDSFDFDPIKAQKAKAIQRYRRIRQIATAFRFLEVVLVLLFLSWCSNHLPLAVKISGGYFRHLLLVAVSPRFVFLVGNTIVIILIAKSRHLSAQNTAGKPDGSDLYEEFLKNSENRRKVVTPVTTELPVEEEKTVIYEEKVRNPAYGRSQSDVSAPEKKKEIRRAVTDVGRKKEKHGEEGAVMLDRKREMSDDEFRLAVEAFIEKQQMRFQKEESMAIVVKDTEK